MRISSQVNNYDVSTGPRKRVGETSRRSLCRLLFSKKSRKSLMNSDTGPQKLLSFVKQQLKNWRGRGARPKVRV